jgi:phosphohistidine phosphatase SixA
MLSARLGRAGFVAVASAWILLPLAVAAQEGEALVAVLRGGGHVLLIRHATAPGVGDPPGFRLEDCATQRNLSEAGREEARRLGAALKARGVPVGRVLSSRWCRCVDTATLAFGRVEPWPPLDSFFADRSRERAQTAEVRRLVGARPRDGNLVLVTHQVNISVLAGVSPASGEVVVLAPQEDATFRVAGRLAPANLGIR